MTPRDTSVDPLSTSGLTEFARLLSRLPVAAYTCDVEGLITYYNDRAVDLWGRAPQMNDPIDRFCGSFRLLALDGTPITHDQCWMALALRDGRAYNGVEIVVERPDGARLVALAHANPIFDELGSMIGAVNVLVDVTEHRRAEGDRLHLAAIVESSDDAIISKDLDGVIRSWNVSAQQLFGYTAEQAVGRHISFLIPPERADEEERILSRLREGGRIYHFDTVRVRSDGQPIHVSVTISPMQDQDGRIVGASKIVRDISDRKRAEQQIYALLKQLKDADRHKDEFLATLAHELRGPLAPLSAVAEILKSGGDAATLERARAMLERQLGQLVRLVDDLLDVSRITSHKLELRAERVELGPVLAQAIEVCRPTADAARHSLELVLPADAVWLVADRARLIQVFGNLLSNACRYTDDGGSICVSAECEESHVVVRVADNGIGIDAEHLPHVFELFSQAREGLEPSRGGLGLGLTLVQRLTEMHGGAVQAASDGPGQGSTFTVRLPIVAAPTGTERSTQPAELPEAVLRRRVLVVDDDEDSATSLAMLLKIRGHETAIARDGLEALAAVETFRPDVALIDISLPKLDGHEAARRIRKLPIGKNIVLIALTGWAQGEDRRRSAAAGFDEHMLKPLDFQALLKRLAI